MAERSPFSFLPCSYVRMKLTSLQEEASEGWGSKSRRQVEGCVSSKGPGIHVSMELWSSKE